MQVVNIRDEAGKDVVSLAVSKTLALKLVHKFGCATMQFQLAILISAVDNRIANHYYGQVLTCTRDHEQHRVFSGCTARLE